MRKLIAIAVLLIAVLLPAAAAATPVRTIALALHGAGAAHAAPKQAFHERHDVPLPAFTEATFKAPAGHGYEMSVNGRRVNFSPAELKKFSDHTPSSYSIVFLDLTRGDGSAEYFPKGTLSGGRLKARLGNLGVLSLRFVPRRVTFHPPYKDCTGRRTRIEHGAFVGKLRFDGEGGYARVLRRRIPGTLTRERPWRCDLTPVSGAPKGTRVGGTAFTPRHVPESPSSPSGRTRPGRGPSPPTRRNPAAG